MIKARSVLPLATIACVLLALSVSAAPTNDNPHSAHDTINDIWSAINLWLYRLLHGGKYPPGYQVGGGSGGPSPSSASISIPASSSAVFSSIISSAFVSASSSAFASSVATSAPAISTSSSSSSSVVSSVSSTVSSTAAQPSSGAGDYRSLPASDPTVCSAQPASSFPVSCSVSSPDNTCCTTSPGGHYLSTQFWDTGSQSTGPNTSFTLHGLWPDNCDGSYEQYCDPSRELTNITQVLKQYQQTDLLNYMDTYWKDYSGDDETFWEHEYNKHGTCVSSLEPRCFNNYTPQEEAVYYFRRAVELYKTLPTYDFLAAAGIYPSLDKSYTLAEITAALEKGLGGSGEVNVNCQKGVFNEVWYHYVVQGSVADGNFIPAPLVGSPSTCPSSGIKYYPKFVTLPTASSTATSSGAAPTSTGTGSSGYLYAVSADGSIASGSCIISGGSWYKGGTCATFTLKEVTGGSFTLTSSKGLCAVDGTSKLLTCSANNSAGSEFLIGSDGTLNLGGSTVFSAAHVPASGEKVDVYRTADQALPLTLKYVGK